MLTLALPPEIQAALLNALLRSGRREIGGILMAEHVGTNEFVVREITIHRIGTFATFVRKIEEAIGRLGSFFERSNRHYERFNYIGEWHSHPSFEAEPSSVDDASIVQIVCDPKVGANFVVLLIVKLDGKGSIRGSVHTYLPDRSRRRSILKFLP
jgi:integrative and conjugative element protein (TIGR02256 family)